MAGRKRGITESGSASQFRLRRTRVLVVPGVNCNVRTRGYGGHVSSSLLEKVTWDV